MKRLLFLIGYPSDQIKMGLSGPHEICDLWLVDFDPFSVFLGSLFLNVRVRSRVFEEGSASSVTLIP